MGLKERLTTSTTTTKSTMSTRIATAAAANAATATTTTETDAPVGPHPMFLDAPPIKSADGIVIEYIPDRLYIGCYSKEPDALTPFPFLPKPAKSSRKTQSKYLHRATQSVAALPVHKPPIYFTVDDCLFYNKFHHDFGPFHIGHLYRFSVVLHDYLGANEYRDRNIVFWSRADPQSRANAACLLACYMILVQGWAPHSALAPLAQVNPPLMPYRDAGYSQADYSLHLQDFVYGVWKAKEMRLMNFRTFNLQEYERYERVDQGDFNWITPDFVAFASPNFPGQQINSKGEKLYQPEQLTEEFFKDYKLPKGIPFPKDLTQLKAMSGKFLGPFRNVLGHFTRRNVGLVIRLNSHLYPAAFFDALGMTHLDMIFDDGTVPPLNLVRRFINLAHETINIKKQKIAVHCKAGLGRTGCLIGAYLIYRYGFTANECMAYMRFMRPGMVVGPQQHWLHLNQQEIRGWWHEDQHSEEKYALLAQIQCLQQMQEQQHEYFSTTPSKRNSMNRKTPPPRRSILGELDQNDLMQQDCLPAPTPGQPRKNSTRFQQSSPRKYSAHENENGNGNGGIHIDTDELSEEEIHLQLTANKREQQHRRRSTSYTITTTTTTISGGVPPTGSNVGKVGNGLTTGKTRISPRRNNSGKEVAGVRKASGRVGSHGSRSLREL